jgi:hypothetical protein
VPMEMADPGNAGDRMKALDGLLRMLTHFRDDPTAPHDVFAKSVQKYTEAPSSGPDEDELRAQVVALLRSRPKP